MFRGLLGWRSSSASAQASGSKRRKQVHQVNDSLYELYKPDGIPTVQVLFFHGLPSGDLSNAHLSTWKSEDDSCVWPQEWLPDTFPRAHIYTVSYSACANIFDVYLLGENLVSDLVQGGIGQITSCPVILVGHCVGGLVIKEICCQAHDKVHLNKTLPIHKEKLEKFLRSTKGIMYYSTPHDGSSIIAKATDGPLFQFFNVLNSTAKRSNIKFEGVQSEYNWLNFGLGELLATTSSLHNYSNVVVVPEASSRQGDHFLMVGADHNSICQPPSKMDRRFYHLKDLIENILNEVEEDATAHGETNVKGTHHINCDQESHLSLANPTTVLNNESLYVPIQSSHLAVIAGIEKPRGVHMILLYGGVGKGKSTLARYMYERYGKDGDNGNLYEHVVWLSCANCSTDDIRTKQFEVLQDHSSHSFGDTLPQHKSLLNNRITKAFQHFLGDKKMLIILDDVTDSRFLYEMYKVGMRAKDVKFLVTSQRSNICSSLGKDSMCIAMGDPTEHEAKAILASHVGLQGRFIPNQLQGIAKKMIHITEGNPLALACLASHFSYSQDNEDIWVWQEAYRDLEDLLNSPEEKIVIGNTECAPRSLWAAMKISIDSLDTMDAKRILCLIYACNGELVPEIVLRIWHARMKTRMKTSRSPLIKSLGELLMRELVKRNRGTMAPHVTDVKDMGEKDETQQWTTFWSLRPLVMLYMRQNMFSKGEIRSLLDELFDNEESSSDGSVGCDGSFETEEIKGEKRRLAIALCALYFDRQHIDGIDAITRTGIATKTTEFFDNVRDLRRKAMESIIWLLDKPVEDGKWTQSDVQCVRKVLLTYICNGQLDDRSISHLLKLDACPMAQMATLKVIWEICIIDEKPLFKKNNLHFLQEIVHLLHLKDRRPTRVQKEACRTLHGICWKAGEDNSTMLIVDTPGVLDIVLSLIAPNNLFLTLKEAAARALSSLAYGNPDLVGWRITSQGRGFISLVKPSSIHEKPAVHEQVGHTLKHLTSTRNNDLQRRIANEDRALADLVKCLACNDCPGLQKNVASTFANLAFTDPIRWTIASEEGALAGLVKLLFADYNPFLRTGAALAMSNLSAAEDDLLILRIANEEGAVEGLLKCIIIDDRPDLQKFATQAVASLARTKPTQTYFLHDEGALASLVKLLSAHEKPAVQEQAGRILSNLISTGNYDLQLRIANEEGALAVLVKCLACNDCPGLQGHVARTFANLAFTDPIRWTIANNEGALAGLVKLLFVDYNPIVRTRAAGAMGNLSATEDDLLILCIANEEGAVEGLLKCIIIDDLPDLQTSAIQAVANLARTKPTQTYFLHDEGALASLVKLLSAHEKPAVQEQAGRILSNLISTGNYDLKLRIANDEGALAGLVKCLACNDCPGLQKNVAGTFANLAFTDPIRWTIANNEGALAGLVKLLFVDYNPILRRGAALAMSNLCAAEDDLLILRIANEEGAVEGLLKCIVIDDRPDLQTYAIQALASLACRKPTQTYFLHEEGALASLVKLLSAHEKPAVQEQAGCMLRNLVSTENYDLMLRIANEEGALAGLVKCVSMRDHPVLQQHATWALWSIAEFEEAKTILKRTEGLFNGFLSLLAHGIAPSTRYIGVRALTVLNPTIGKEARLTSPDAYCGRADAFIFLGMNVEALADLDLAADILHGADATILSVRCVVKAKLEDFEGALDDANEAVKLRDSNDRDPFAFRERGVLKIMMGDLEGALADLDEGLILDADDYESLKHRGYVKFLLKDENGARTDAEWALRNKPPRVDLDRYGRSGFLGASPAEYIGYKLK